MFVHVYNTAWQLLNQLYNTMYSKESIDKIGNTIIYFTEKGALSKTKLLKLIYLLEEISIIKYGIPFFNIPFQVWKFGPVANDIFVEFSSSPSMLKGYINRRLVGNSSLIEGMKEFNDDEFSDNDIELIDMVISRYAHKSADELVRITHHKGSLWYSYAKSAGVLDALENEEISNTDILIDLRKLIENNPQKKGMYDGYIEVFGNPLNKPVYV